MGRMAEIVRRKEDELNTLRYTVNAECAERARLLGLLAQYGHGGGNAAPPQTAPPGAPLPLQSQSPPRGNAAATDPDTQWKQAHREVGKRGGRGGHGVPSGKWH